MGIRYGTTLSTSGTAAVPTQRGRHLSALLLPGETTRRAVALSADVLAREIVPAADERFAHNTLVLDMRALHNAFDALVVTSGSSRLHVHSVALGVIARVERTLGVRPTSVEGWGPGRWVAIDYDEVIVHVFDDTSREYYDLEYLWRDAPVTASKQWLPDPAKALI